MMIERRAYSAVIDGLEHQAAVVLTGPRQVGKTTLALEIAAQRNALYLDLELPGDRARLSSPQLFLESVSDQLVILDEVQQIPDIFSTLRGLIDRGRREGKGTGRFLLLGSASLDLLRQSESLAGRVAYVEMTPISPLEVPNDRATRDRLWLRGGFPRSFLASSDLRSFQTRRESLQSLLARDIQEFSPRIPASTLERFLTILAHRQGSPLNSAEIGRAIEHSTQSASRYVDLLVDFLLIRRLPPFFANVSKRLTKSPKVYIRDSGLVHSLLGIETFDQLVGSPGMGMSWEGFVIETLISVLPWNAHPFFYRTAVGAEIDLIIQFPDTSIWAIEVKRTLETKISRGYHEARADLKPARSFVVHGDNDRFPLSAEIEAISLVGLANELLALSRF
ncbi:ATP-binding protein [soil metagenome]